MRSPCKILEFHLPWTGQDDIEVPVPRALDFSESISASAPGDPPIPGLTSGTPSSLFQWDPGEPPLGQSRSLVDASACTASTRLRDCPRGGSPGSH